MWEIFIKYIGIYFNYCIGIEYGGDFCFGMVVYK